MRWNVCWSRFMMSHSMRGPDIEPSLFVTRILNAPCEKVFAAWTTAEYVQRWMCPENGTVAAAELDLRVGGAFRIDMLANGVQTSHTGVYREISPPHRLVFTWVSTYTYFRDTLVTVDLRALGDKTELTITQTLLPDEISREGHTWGWTQIMDHLVNYLQTR
jgi:uncharacterized protein YndB with AHSA1/START domain